MFERRKFERLKRKADIDGSIKILSDTKDRNRKAAADALLDLLADTASRSGRG